MSNLVTRLAKMPSDQKRATLANLPTHLANAAQAERLQSLLTNFGFIEAKVSELEPQSLIEDYNLASNPCLLTSQEKTESLKTIQAALRLSADTLVRDKNQLAGQLLGRLISCSKPEIQEMLAQAKPRNNIWLCPIIDSLASPEGFLIRTFTNHSNIVSAIAVTRDGKQMISGSWDSSVKVWNFETGEELFTFTGHVDRVNALAVTPDSQWVISGSRDCTIQVWNLKTGEQLLTISDHPDSIEALAVSPDGKYIISGSWEGTVKVWNLITGEELLALNLHKEPVRSVAITKNHIISSSDDKTIHVLKPEEKQLIILLAHQESVWAIAIT
ncbi:MAG: WD40 repeat domain-containing protein, partial [Symploca sp. SIO1B1]|nr:WD40 repeat domain-containing protein [Symploca sp. SIO1B1]